MCYEEADDAFGAEGEESAAGFGKRSTSGIDIIKNNYSTTTDGEAIGGHASFNI